MEHLTIDEEFIRNLVRLNLDSIKELLDKDKIEFEDFKKIDAKNKLKGIFDTIHKNKNTELIKHDIKCNFCNAKLIAFVGNKSPHYIILKFEQKQGKIILSNCVNEYPDFKLNGLKLMRAYELMMGIRQPEPDLSPDLFGENESIKQLRDWGL